MNFTQMNALMEFNFKSNKTDEIRFGLGIDEDAEKTRIKIFHSGRQIPL